MQFLNNYNIKGSKSAFPDFFFFTGEFRIDSFYINISSTNKNFILKLCNNLLTYTKPKYLIDFKDQHFKIVI